jgi:transposase
MAYSQDLRDRVIEAVLVEGMSRRGAGVRFGVSETAAINWVKRVELTGSRTPAQIGGYKPMMLAPHRAFVEAACHDQPDVTLQDLCDRLLAERGVRTYTSVMSRFLRHLGVTLKKRRWSLARETGLTSAATAGAGSSGKRRSTHRAWSSSTRRGPRPT